MAYAPAASLYDVQDQAVIGNFWKSSPTTGDMVIEKFLIEQISETLQTDLAHIKASMKNPIDKDLHKASTKVMEKIFESDSNDSLIE